MEKVKNKFEIYRDECGYSNSFKATRQPVCGCTSCWDKWFDEEESEIDDYWEAYSREHRVL